MNNKNPLDDVNKIIDELARIEETKNISILNIITKRIGEMSLLSLSELYSVAQLQHRINDLNEIERILTEFRGLEDHLIKKAIKISAMVNYNTTKTILDNANTVRILPAISNNKKVLDIIKGNMQLATKQFINTYQTQAFMLRDPFDPTNLIPTPISEAYQKAIDKATETIINAPKIYSEAERSINYTQQMRKTVKELADSGVRVVVGDTNKVLYQTEKYRFHTQRLDTAVRRNVLDSVRKVNQEVQNEVGNQIGADGVEITVHTFPAEDHAPVQGHQFTNEEFEKMQNEYSFQDVQGRHYEGFKRAIGMWNCRHFTFSILVGVFPQTYTDNQLADILLENEKGYTLPNGKHLTMYECTQRQRQLETKIRYAKEHKIAAQNANDTLAANKYESQVNQLLDDYRTFSAACKLPKYLKNTFVPGY